MKLLLSILSCLFLINTMHAQSSSNYSLYEDIGVFPNAFNLQQGEIKLHNSDIKLISYKQGITNHLSAGISTVISPVIPSRIQRIRYDRAILLRLKFTQSLSKNIHIGITPSINFQNFYEDPQFHPMLVGSLSLGKPEGFFNLTYTRGFAGTYFKGQDSSASSYVLRLRRQKESEPIEPFKSLTFGGTLKVSKKLALHSENLIDFEFEEFIPSIALSWAIKKNQILRLGAFIVEMDYGLYLPLPSISYSLHWGLEK